MATKKPAPKAKAAKPAAKKPAAKPAAKVAPKAAAKKPAAKPVAKKAAPKPAAKAPVAKAPVKKVAPKAAPKAVAKAAPKKAAAKPAAKSAAKAAAKKPVAKPVAKKPEPKVVAKPVKAVKVEKPAKPAKAEKPAKVEVKKIVKVAPKVETKKVEKAPAKVGEPSGAVNYRPVVKAVAEDKAPKKPLAMPKITTTTSRAYKPDFTKSVLDKAAEPVVEETAMVRYNDNDLMEFRELIIRKLTAAKKELSYLQGLITRKDSTGGDDSDGRYMTMEDGSLSMEREQLSQMASRQITFIDHLEKAMVRVENKTYGICRVTGKLIDKARLRAVPHATLSIEAKMNGGKKP
jgi:RNA polymerase-binding transcription factor DksA